MWIALDPCCTYQFGVDRWIEWITEHLDWRLDPPVVRVGFLFLLFGFGQTETEQNGKCRCEDDRSSWGRADGIGNSSSGRHARHRRMPPRCRPSSSFLCFLFHLFLHQPSCFQIPPLSGHNFLFFHHIYIYIYIFLSYVMLYFSTRTFFHRKLNNKRGTFLFEWITDLIFEIENSR